MKPSFDLGRRFAAAATLIALAACSGGGHSVAPTVATGGAGPTLSSGPVAASSVTRSVLNAPGAFASSVTMVGPATSIGTVVLHVVPNLQNGAGLATYAQQVSTPGNANYRHFLTASDIGSRFGATLTDYTAVANYFASYGLKVGGWPQRLALTVAGPRASMEKALGTTYAFYKTKTTGQTVLAPVGNIQFSKAIPVDSIPDAIMVPQRRKPANVIAANAPSQTRFGGLAPQQIATAFDFNSAYSAGFTGSGIKIGIMGTGPAMQADLTAYKAQYGFGGASALTFPAVTAAAAANTAAAGAGGSPTATPPPVTGPCDVSGNPNFPPSESPSSSCNPEDGEAQIDTEQAALAKDASIEFYLAYVPVECYAPGPPTCGAPDPTTGLGYDYQGLAEVDDEIQQIIADDTADVVSGSFGEPEIFYDAIGYTGYITGSNGELDPNALEPSEMAAMTTEGMAVFISSADSGAQTCAEFFGGAIGALQCVSYPASDPNVTAVGGVTLPVDNAGNLLGPITGWGQQTGNGGSGGGVSCITSTPSWQVQPSWESGPSLISAAQATSSTSASACSSSLLGLDITGGRVVPDISLEGDAETGVAVVGNTAFGGATQSVYGGTSVAAPEMAAMWALVLQACKQTVSCATAGGPYPYRLGNAAPLLWGLYQSQTTYNSSIYDVTFGNNGLQLCELSSIYGPCTSPTPTPAPGFPAGAGWDGITGLGVPFARHLITAIVGS